MESLRRHYEPWILLITGYLVCDTVLAITMTQTGGMFSFGQLWKAINGEQVWAMGSPLTQGMAFANVAGLSIPLIIAVGLVFSPRSARRTVVVGCVAGAITEFAWYFASLSTPPPFGSDYSVAETAVWMLRYKYPQLACYVVAGLTISVCRLSGQRFFVPVAAYMVTHRCLTLYQTASLASAPQQAGAPVRPKIPIWEMPWWVWYPIMLIASALLLMDRKRARVWSTMLAAVYTLAVGIGHYFRTCQGQWKYFLPGPGNGKWQIHYYITVAMHVGFIWLVFRYNHPESDANVCRECDYDLTGNVSGVCPECGAAVPLTAGEQG